MTCQSMPLGPFAHLALSHWSFHLSSSTSGTLLPQNLCRCCSPCLNSLLPYVHIAPHLTSFKSRLRWCFLCKVYPDHPTYNSNVNFLSHSGISDSFLSHSTWVFQKHLSPFHKLFPSHIYFIYCPSPPLEYKFHKSRAFYSLLHLQYLKNCLIIVGYLKVVVQWINEKKVIKEKAGQNGKCV